MVVEQQVERQCAGDRADVSERIELVQTSREQLDLRFASVSFAQQELPYSNNNVSR